MNLLKIEIRNLIERDKKIIPDAARINCEYCDGTGLECERTETNIFWDGTSFCSHCKGAGTWDWVEFLTKN